MKIILNDSLVSSMTEIFKRDTSFTIGEHCIRFAGYSSLDGKTTFTTEVVPHTDKPQFHNGDTVYDENGVSYVYIGLHHKHDMTSVVYHLEAEEYIDVPNNELYSEKPVTPKDGEWWMCELTEGHPIRNVIAIYNCEHWYWDASFVVEHDRGIKPLYRMIRDTDSE